MTENKKIRVATRGSKLALTQTGHVIAAMEQAFPHLEFETVVVQTTGDQMQKGAVKPESITKNIFTREIEVALLKGEADIAVHSCKDLGVEMPPGLQLAGCPPRRSPRDLLIVKSGSRLNDHAAVILTGSIRRRLQWQEHHPQHVVHPIRGNIDTRIRKMCEHPEADALILAQAGLDRLNPDLSDCYTQVLDVTQMIPAPGQGALALQCRDGDDEIFHVIDSISDYATFQSILAERAFLAAMNAGCQEPLGAIATPLAGGKLKLSAVYYYQDDPASAHRAELIGDIDEPDELAQKLSLHFDQ